VKSFILKIDSTIFLFQLYYIFFHTMNYKSFVSKIKTFQLLSNQNHKKKNNNFHFNLSKLITQKFQQILNYQIIKWLKLI